MIQILSAYEVYPNKAGYKDNGCSKEAAAKIDVKLSALQAAVLDALCCHSEGATADEVALTAGILRDTAKARLTELKIKGKVKKTKRRGKTLTGGNCSIWEIV